MRCQCTAAKVDRKASWFRGYFVTIRERTCVFATRPPVAETVTLLSPATALDPAANISMLPLLLIAATLAGLNVAVTPFGSRLTASVIVEVNPLNNAPEMFT